jgi:hypothetical protein
VLTSLCWVLGVGVISMAIATCRAGVVTREQVLDEACPLEVSELCFEDLPVAVHITIALTSFAATAQQLKL